ncbi:interleukin-36 gamma-like isoform X2 [Notamacropus eugenii]|uniref:interleukin-36 gamma-like isoform X2 n=1 Tax=Notamacropus eugenii TaxID=9315 RepID=UPI003B670237
MDNNDAHKFAMQKPSLFRIQDSNQQVLALKDNTLIATPHSDHVTPVDLESMPCRDKELLTGNHGTAVYLGIRGKELCLFCEESGGQAILKLNTNTTSTFESAAFPGWFICTSNEMDRPVTMTQNRGTNYNTAFFLTSLK